MGRDKIKSLPNFFIKLNLKLCRFLEEFYGKVKLCKVDFKRKEMISMPMLKFRGISKAEVINKSKLLVDKLAECIECPRDYFTLEVIDSKYVFDGEYVEQPSIIEIAWFYRGQKVQDEVAKIITELFKGNREYLEVFFIKLKEECYYENGEHF